MLVGQQHDQTLLRARALAEGIKDVAAELRLINVADFIAYIHLEKFANIQDIVNSSVELFFKHGTLSYGLAADFELDWGNTPSIFIDMEFRHMSVSVIFSLVLRALHASVDIRAISFGEGSKNPEADTQHLIAAIADARLPGRGC
jgi:hypothetical protein